jgi:hypothetical protein
LTPTLRFGVFELDPRAGELRKKGMKVRLQGQPVEILVMLLERPGETITREEQAMKWSFARLPLPEHLDCNTFELTTSREVSLLSVPVGCLSSMRSDVSRVS